jgi:hypothetical protein
LAIYAFLEIIDDPNPEDVDQAKEDRKAYGQLFTLQYLTLKTQFNL